MILAGLALAGLAGAAQAGARPARPVLPDIMALGSPTAPVTVAEYTSLGCDHCISWALGVYPAFKAKYIDTGKVRFELHEILGGDSALAMAGFLTARCAGEDKYFEVVEKVFHSREELGRGGIDAMAEIAAGAGLDRPRFDACFKDAKAQNGMRDRIAKDGIAHNINNIPSFVVNGLAYDMGEMSLKELDAAIAKAMAAAKGAP